MVSQNILKSLYFIHQITRSIIGQFPNSHADRYIIFVILIYYCCFCSISVPGHSIDVTKPVSTQAIMERMTNGESAAMK